MWPFKYLGVFYFKFVASFPLAICCAAAVFGIAPTALHASLPSSFFQPVALTNTDGPLGPQLGAGVYFATLPTNPSLNSSGNLGFSASLTGAGITTANDQGDWLFASNSMQPIARIGTAGPLGPNQGSATFVRNGLSGPQLDNNGQITINAFSSTSGIWRHTGSTNTAIAMANTDGPLGPNLGAGIDFISTLPTPVSINDGSLVLSHLVLPSDPTYGGQAGLWRIGPTGNPTVLARENFPGALGPGLDAGTVFGGSLVPIVNRQGTVALNARLLNSQTSFSGSGLLRLSDTGNTLLAETGTDGALGPQLGAGVTFTGFAGLRPLNDTDYLARATLAGTGVTTTNGDVIVRIGPSSITPLAREGTDGALGPQLGAGVVFAAPVSAAQAVPFGAITGHDQNFAFFGHLSGNGYDPNTVIGLWIGSGTQLAPAVLTNTDGPLGPGLGPNVAFKNFPAIAMADDNTLFFSATTGQIGQTPTQSGLWYFQNDALTSIIRAGDSFAPNPANPADVRTVSAVGSSLVLDPINSRLAINLTFTDSSVGLLLVSVPEPAGGAGLLFALGLASLRRRRKVN